MKKVYVSILWLSQDDSLIIGVYDNKEFCLSENERIYKSDPIYSGYNSEDINKRDIRVFELNNSNSEEILKN